MGAYTEIVDFTFTANETSRTFSGLSITKDDFLKIVVNHKNTTSGSVDVRLLANNSVTTNYTRQLLLGSISATNASRVNESLLLGTGSNDTSTTISYVKLSENDRFNIFSQNTFRDSDTIQLRFIYTTSSGATFTSGITSLTFTANTTNGLATGSRIQIYRLDAEKIADITVTSNTTQVDISNLSIDKDSEYLLVSDTVNTQTTTTGNFITPNDATTLTNYHRQLVIGEGSSTIASRENESRYAFTRNVDTASNRTLAYVHIKLSNIGAFTYQSYGIPSYGSSIMLLENDFGSSTAENITTITKLNLFTNISNAIGSGSRFILYKLYE